MSHVDIDFGVSVKSALFKLVKTGHGQTLKGNRECSVEFTTRAYDGAWVVEVLTGRQLVAIGILEDAGGMVGVKSFEVRSPDHARSVLFTGQWIAVTNSLLEVFNSGWYLDTMHNRETGTPDIIAVNRGVKRFLIDKAPIVLWDSARKGSRGFLIK